MSLGWAFGHLCVYFVLDGKSPVQWACGEEASELQRALCLLLRPGAAVLFTLFSACVITLSLACSHRGAARRGVADLCARRCPPWAWELLCAQGRLFRAALGTMIMVLWNEVRARTVTSTLREEPIITLSQVSAP